MQNVAALPTQRSVAPVLQLASDSILTAQMRREMASEPRLADFAVTGGPQFVRHTAEDDPTKPLLIYLPGIELSGYSLHRQLPGLAEDFCVRWLAVPPDDRSSFEALREAVTREVEAEEGRPIYLLGASSLSLSLSGLWCDPLRRRGQATERRGLPPCPLACTGTVCVLACACAFVRARTCERLATD